MNQDKLEEIEHKVDQIESDNIYSAIYDLKAVINELIEYLKEKE